MLVVTFNSLVASYVRSKVSVASAKQGRATGKKGAKSKTNSSCFFFLANERACLLKKTRVFYLKLTMWHVLRPKDLCLLLCLL